MSGKGDVFISEFRKMRLKSSMSNQNVESFIVVNTMEV